VLGLGVRDSTAGFRCYTASILQRLDLERIRAEGYGFQIEMTYRSKQHGAAITEVPIAFVDRAAGESKMSSFIVVEALALVTWWGLGRLVAPLRRVGRKGKRGAGGGGAAATPSGTSTGSSRSNGSLGSSGPSDSDSGEPDEVRVR
jgi:hypothetical protein